MKALTFTEFFKAYEGEEISLLSEANWSESLAKHLRHLQKYHDFVCQDFRPEMIQELFIGFEKKSVIAYTFGNVTFEFNFDVYMIQKPSENYNDYNRIWFPLCQTLNDFISDCSRSGIELTWKEVVII